MNTTKYNPKFKTMKLCQSILDNISSSQYDKDTATSRIVDIKKWLVNKNETTPKSESSFDESVNQEIDQEAEIIAIAHSIVTQRYPNMKQDDGVFGQIINATANRLVELRKIKAIHKLAQKEVIVN